MLNDEITQLAGEYIKNNVIPADYKEECFHIAYATLNEIDYLLSWNFRHIVNLKTKQIINTINLTLKYPELKIITPAELL